MKKGLSYVDWSISAGIFIISLVTIFVLFAPAFKQETSSEYLNSIVKDSIEDNIVLELKRIPIFIDVNTTGKSGSETYLFTLQNLPKELSSSNDNQITIYTKTGQEITTKNLNYPNSLTVSTTLSILGVSPNIGSVITSLYLFVSPLDMFNDATTSGTPLTITNTFGVSEEVKGVYESKFLEFSSNSYENAKTILNYPKERGFSIEIYNETDLEKNPLLYYTKDIPSEEDNVGVLLWSTWLIHNDTLKTPVTVLIKTW